MWVSGVMVTYFFFRYAALRSMEIDMWVSGVVVTYFFFRYAALNGDGHVGVRCHGNSWRCS